MLILRIRGRKHYTKFENSNQIDKQMENLAFEQRDSGLYKAILSASVKSVALLPRSKESFNRNYTINYLA